MAFKKKKKKKKKKSHSNFDFKPKTLKVELARDIIIPNICVKLYQNTSINIGARVMTKREHTYVGTYLRTGQTLYPLATSLCEGITLIWPVCLIRLRVHPCPPYLQVSGISDQN